MKTKKPQLLKFQFWKDNQLDQYFELSFNELKEKFISWVKTKEKSWCEYYGLYQVYLVFVGDQSGLASVSESEENNEFVKMVKEEFWNTVNTLS